MIQDCNLFAEKNFTVQALVRNSQRNDNDDEDTCKWNVFACIIINTLSLSYTRQTECVVVCVFERERERQGESERY